MQHLFNRYKSFGIWIAVIAVAALAAPLDAWAANPCNNSKGRRSPGRLQLNLALALEGQPEECEWWRDVRQGFPNSLGGGSYNIPVLAAAIAFVKEPVRFGSWNMNTWWDTYLKGELGLRGNQWYYGGKELSSSVYQQYNIGAVLAVHYEADRTGKTAIANLARRWLKATFALHALAAAPSRPTSLNNDVTFLPSGTSRTDVHNIRSGYVGPWIGTAGMRSTFVSQQRVTRGILFARAVGLHTNARFESTDQFRTRDAIEKAWRRTDINAYGLSGTDRAHLRDVVGRAVISPRVRSWISGIRTIQRIHYVRWGGTRLTLLERNNNNETAPTYGVAYFASTGKAHTLYPWDINRTNRNGIKPGSARLDLANGRMTAENWNVVGGIEDVSHIHGKIRATVTGLPRTNPTYHITCDRNVGCR